MARYAVIDHGGNVVNAVEWDGIAVFSIENAALVLSDDAGVGWTYTKESGFVAPPPPAPPPPQTTISALAFFNRFTEAEQIAVQTAASAIPALGVGLVNGLAAGQIFLTSMAVGSWLDGLVTAGAITVDRKTEILTP